MRARLAKFREFTDEHVYNPSREKLGDSPIVEVTFEVIYRILATALKLAAYAAAIYGLVRFVKWAWAG